MTAAAPGWQFEAEAVASLPPLAWVARLTPGRVRAVCGTSVRVDDNALFEGTWAGPAALGSLPEQTTVFGSGLVIRGDEAVVVTPSHHLEGVHRAMLADSVVLSNSLAGALIAARLELDRAFDYPTLFAAGMDRWTLIPDESAPPPRPIVGALQAMPTTTVPLTTHYFENAVVGGDLAVRLERKPRERPFESFGDYRDRLVAATTSLFENAGDYEPVVSLSGGYDSTAVAAVAVAAGCKRSVGFALSRPARSDRSTTDSGAATAAALGLSYREFDRLAYLAHEGTPEAEFLSTGMVGEEIMFQAFEEEELKHSILLNGFWAGTQWAMSHRDDWRRYAPSTTAGASLTEFRLRADFDTVPLPVFGAAQDPDGPSLLDLPEMAPYRIYGGHYDRPVPRRLAEEAGIMRGSFAVRKRASSVLLQHDVLENFTPTTRRSVEEFAAAERRELHKGPRRSLSRSDRLALRVAERLRLRHLVHGIERRQVALTHFEPQLGNLLFRWAVSEMRPRYVATERLWQ